MEREIIKIDLLYAIKICVFFIAGGIAGIVVGAVALAVIPGVILIGCIIYNTIKEKVCCFYAD